MAARSKTGILGIAIMLGGLACGPAGEAGLALQVRFASKQQAETRAPGLPLGIRSYLVQARAGGPQGSLLAGTGCIDVDDRASRRQSVKLDVTPGSGIALIVAGYEAAGCTSSMDWRGMATGVEVVEGQTTRVAVYVTRRGLHVNDSRASFPRPRVFATATSLLDGRVLIAGGFDVVSQEGGEARLEAACDAGIYDPGTARFERFVSLAGGCRGFHRAVLLGDGKILLVGGTRLASARVDGGLSILPSKDDLMQSGDLFDPATGSFHQVGPDDLLGRADAAAVALADDKVLLMGGRTREGRTTDVVVGSPSGEGVWNWVRNQDGLQDARTGARAVVLDQGVLLVGGAGPDSQWTGELIDPASGESLAGVEGQALLGQSLTRLDFSTAVAAGGAGDFPGARAVDEVLQIEVRNDSPVVSEQSLVRPRAYHAAHLLDDGSVLLAGGIDGRGGTRSDLEVWSPSGGSRMLEDSLGTGAVGLAAARLPDGSVLLAGGMGIQDGRVVLSGTVQIVSP